MVRHIELTSEELWKYIKHGRIPLGGNLTLKIYGTLKCKSGKRMKKENRVFFESEEEAVEQGFRPCGRCMTVEYKRWKNGII